MPAVLDSPVMLKLDVEKMRALRAELKLNQRDAAARVGMALTRWSDIESGTRANVTIETLGLLAEALGCEPAALLVVEKRGRKR